MPRGNDNAATEMTSERGISFTAGGGGGGCGRGGG